MVRKVGAGRAWRRGVAWRGMWTACVGERGGGGASVETWHGAARRVDRIR
jgi:hypothetical protein